MKKRTTASAYRRNIELSNLDKVLFPGEHIVKAELIEYYLKIAPTILKHVKGRALSFVRYPDGIAGPSFFQKNRPDWAPDWIRHVHLGEDRKIDYILATEEACLVWFANLACIELHQVHGRTPHLEQPDYMVFDLDPPEKYVFGRVIELAFELREHIERFGYHAFVKTTGGKGLHVVAPIEPRWGLDPVFEAISAVARPFVKAHGDTSTLHIKKEARKGRVLIDIYRNRHAQTIVSPYSREGEAGGSGVDAALMGSPRAGRGPSGVQPPDGRRPPDPRGGRPGRRSTPMPSSSTPPGAPGRAGNGAARGVPRP